jgi:hypothetical protein
LAALSERVKLIPSQLLLLEDGTLAFVIMKKECGKAIASSGVDDDGAIPPTQARWPD